MKSSTILIANPAAKRASEKKLQHAVMLLRSAGHEVNFHLTGKRGDAEEFARKACLENAGLILACGGDGTINEVINGAAYSGINIGIIPMGTTNVLAKELSVPEDTEGAVKRALNGTVHKVSLGKITLACYSSLVTRYFCLMAGIGFDGSAVYNIDESIKRYSGKGAYIISGLNALAGYSPETLVFIADGKTYTGYSAIICKASRYGGNFRVAPEASLTEPVFYAYIMHGGKRADLIRYVFGILMGTHLKFKDTTYIKAASIEVIGKAHIQTDGDYLGTTPATITVAPNALQLLY